MLTVAKREPASGLIDWKARSRRRRTRCSVAEKRWGDGDKGRMAVKGLPGGGEPPAIPVEVVEPWTLNVARSLRSCRLVVGSLNAAQISRGANPQSDRLIRARISCCRSVDRTTVTRPSHLRGASRKGIVTQPPLSSISGPGSPSTVLSVPSAHSSTCQVDRRFGRPAESGDSNSFAGLNANCSVPVSVTPMLSSNSATPTQLLPIEWRR